MSQLAKPKVKRRTIAATADTLFFLIIEIPARNEATEVRKLLKKYPILDNMLYHGRRV